jgi:hypothetical protein
LNSIDRPDSRIHPGCGWACSATTPTRSSRRSLPPHCRTGLALRRALASSSSRRASPRRLGYERQRRAHDCERGATDPLRSAGSLSASPDSLPWLPPFNALRCGVRYSCLGRTSTCPARSNRGATWSRRSLASSGASAACAKAAAHRRGLFGRAGEASGRSNRQLHTTWSDGTDDSRITRSRTPLDARASRPSGTRNQ